MPISRMASLLLLPLLPLCDVPNASRLAGAGPPLTPPAAAKADAELHVVGLYEPAVRSCSG